LSRIIGPDICFLREVALIILTGTVVVVVGGTVVLFVCTVVAVDTEVVLVVG
jgi:hypothetical protein